MADADKPKDGEDEAQNRTTEAGDIVEGADSIGAEDGSRASVSDTPRAGFADDRADDDGMAPPPERDPDAPTPETGDHSVTPIEADPAETNRAGTPSTDTIAADDARSEDSPGPSPSAAAAPAATEKVIERRGGFFPMMFGGIVAAAAGFGLSQYLGPNGWPFSTGGGAFEEETRAALSDTQSGLDALGSRIDGVETGLSDIDLGGIETTVAGLVDRTATLGTELTALAARVDTLAGDGETGDTTLSDLSAEITGLQRGLEAISSEAGTLAERVAAVEKAPMEDAVSPETVAAYERELEELQSRVEEQRSGFEAASAERTAQMEQAFAEQQSRMEETFADQQSQIEAQRAELQAMVDEARAAEAEAERMASLAQLRAAAADLVSAVRTGEPYADALGPLQAEMEIPEALSAPAADGVPTQAALIETYPEAARAGLAAARSATGDGEGPNRLASFMARQLGARSVTPQEGESPDAILSRAEAAVDGGDLQAALTELSALPQPAQEAMSGWISRARARAEAVAAADGLVQQLNQQ